MDRSEARRRQSATVKVMARLQATPNQWVSWQEIAEIGGACAWRTRVSDVRKIARKQDCDVEWNRKLSSAYRWVPRALGPRAGIYREVRLFT